MKKTKTHTNTIAPCTVHTCQNTPVISLGDRNFCAEHAHSLIEIGRASCRERV